MTTTKLNRLLKSLLAPDGSLIDGIPWREDWQVSALDAPCIVSIIDMTAADIPRNSTASASVTFELRLPYQDYTDEAALTVAEACFAKIAQTDLTGKDGDDCILYQFDWQSTQTPNADETEGLRTFSVVYSALVQY